VFDALKAQAPEMQVGWNEPYAAKDGVTFTLERHGDARGLAATMIEIRNTEILEPAGVGAWAERLARCLEIARAGRPGRRDS
jgi:predicted N-formylglutamate amidohydrolase